jgi:hypothetical protein
MGGFASKFDPAAFNAADGGYTSAETTLSGCPPTEAVETLTCLPMKQMSIGTKYELTVLPSEDAPMDSPLYEVKDLDRFKHGFNVVDGSGNVLLRANAGTPHEFWLYTKEPNFPGQIPDPALNLYKRACVRYDADHRQSSVHPVRAPTEEEKVFVSQLQGVVDKAVLIYEVVRSHTITLQAYKPSDPKSLVGHWSWSKPISVPFVKDKIELKVAKNSDVVLFVALVAISRGIRAAEFKGNLGDIM